MNKLAPAPLLGATAYVARSSTYGVRHYSKVKIIKITPTGRIVAKFELGEAEYTFTPDGSRFGGNNDYNHLWLVTDAERVEKEMKTESALRDAEAAMNKTASALTSFRHTYGADSAREAIAKAREELALAEAALLGL